MENCVFIDCFVVLLLYVVKLVTVHGIILHTACTSWLLRSPEGTKAKRISSKMTSAL